jgi:hypothetical protein
VAEEGDLAALQQAGGAVEGERQAEKRRCQAGASDDAAPAGA